jgi:enoyl-CoA hydratase/carnithine racemase
VVIAAQGAAIAGGCALLCSADWVISNPDAWIGYPALGIGISPAVSAPTLASRIGHARARELLLRPEAIPAKQAHAIGLVDQLIDDPMEALGAALDRARSLTSASPAACAHTGAWIDQLDQNLPFSDNALNASRSLVGQREQVELLQAALNRKPAHRIPGSTP